MPLRVLGRRNANFCHPDCRVRSLLRLHISVSSCSRAPDRLTLPKTTECFVPAHSVPVPKRLDLRCPLGPLERQEGRFPTRMEALGVASSRSPMPTPDTLTCML